MPEESQASDSSPSPDDLALLEEKEEIEGAEPSEEGGEVKEAPEEEEEVKETPEGEEEGGEEKEEGEEKKEEEKPPRLLFDRPTFREIREKYPDFFKDFPELRDAFFREQEFTKFFPTVEDAKDAAQDVEAFRVLRDSVLEGDPKPLMDSIEEVDEKSLEKFSLAFLPTLYRRDSALYMKAITPILENVVRSMHSQGVKSKDEDLMNAALHSSLFLFDTEDVATGKRTTVEPKKEPSEEAKQLAEERKSREMERYKAFYSAVDTDISRSLRAMILKGFDPDEVFTPFLKRKCVEEVLDRIGAALEADSGHMAVMKSRWAAAGRNRYSEDEKAKITSAYLARAKSLLPSIREKVRREALDSTSKEARKTGERSETQAEKGEKVSVGEAKRKSGTSLDAKKLDWRKYSDLDILEGRVS